MSPSCQKIPTFSFDSVSQQKKTGKTRETKGRKLAPKNWQKRHSQTIGLKRKWKIAIQAIQSDPFIHNLVVTEPLKGSLNHSKKGTFAELWGSTSLEEELIWSTCWHLFSPYKNHQLLRPFNLFTHFLLDGRQGATYLSLQKGIWSTAAMMTTHWSWSPCAAHAPICLSEKWQGDPHQLDLENASVRLAQTDQKPRERAVDLPPSVWNLFCRQTLNSKR